MNRLHRVFVDDYQQFCLEEFLHAVKAAFDRKDAEKNRERYKARRARATTLPAVGSRRQQPNRPAAGIPPGEATIERRGVSAVTQPGPRPFAPEFVRMFNRERAS